MIVNFDNAIIFCQREGGFEAALGHINTVLGSPARGVKICRDSDSARRLSSISLLYVFG